MINKRRKIIIFGLLGIIILSSTGVDADFELGQFWSGIDNTVVLTDPTNNTNIGENRTTDNKLNVNGTFHVINGTSTFDDDILLNADFLLDGSYVMQDIPNDFIIRKSLTSETWIQIPTPVVGFSQIAFEGGSYTVIDSVNTQTIIGQKNFFNPITFFAEKLVHSNDGDTYVEFTLDKISIFSGGREMVSFVEGFVDQVIINPDAIGIEFIVRTDEHVESFKVTTEPNIEMNLDLDAYVDVRVGDHLTYGSINYAEMWFHNDTSPNVTGIPLVNSWRNVTAFTQNDNGNRGVGFVFIDGNLSCQKSGLYKVDYSITVSGFANNKYHFIVSTENRGNYENWFNTESHERMASSNDILTVGGTGFVEIEPSEKINLRVLNENGANAVTVYSANLNLVRVGNI